MNERMTHCDRRRVLYLWLFSLSMDRLARERSRMVTPEADSDEGNAAIDREPRGTFAKRGGALVLDAVDQAGQEAGLVPGLTLAEARMQVPHLRVTPSDPAADNRLLLSLARAVDRYTPFVGIDQPNGLFLDITGCAHLFGGEDGLVDDLRSRFARWRLNVRTGIADNPGTAWAITRHAGGGIVPPGDGARRLAPLPVEALRLPEEMAAALSRLGLKSVGHLRQQSRAALTRRFGSRLTQRLDQAEGREGEPIEPLSPSPLLVVEHRFAEPLAEMEGVFVALEELAKELAGRVRERGRGARRLAFRLLQADGMVHDVWAGASESLADPARMAALLRPRLERLSSRVERDSGIDSVRLWAVETALLNPRQIRLDGEDEMSADLARLIDTLTARLGAGSVREAVRTDTHQPAQSVAWRPIEVAPQQEARKARRRAPGDGEAVSPTRPELPFLPRVATRPIRLFDPPERVETLASVPDGPPIRFVWRRIFYHVRAAEGPERIAPSWWEGDGETCDYFRVEDQAGRRFWMFRQGLYGANEEAPRWFVHGLFA
ncbi:DNA polymerase Y family protein [Acuticoccus sp. M5D2P5]|uniref:Y-family DNA polymerase n=1 Tax=Acuticoccus kalidii TaxID=2910977 RepID=UPI001F3504ED|nr:DNA polymerase Y family protein [Acuticoccus kalidii]MCF3932285.1 DNA polymerase Y family protein [Acuticoccus kalidii]